MAKAGLSDIAIALVRLADAADRFVFLLEALAAHMDIVHPDDVNIEFPTKKGNVDG